MATTSLWRINGQMGHVINYVENIDKTTSPMEVPGGLSSDTLEDLIAYAGREGATNKRKLIAGINLDYHDAKNQMMIIKRKFEKENGTIAYHGYQSFAEGEVDPDTAHRIGIALAEELWGDRFQVVVCTHLDKASHIHNHFVINTVSHIDGRKFFRSESDYRKMREVSDRLCREYGLSVIKNPEGTGKHYSQYVAERNGKPTFGSSIRADIDKAIKASLTESEFYDMLEAMGYEFKFYSKNGKPLERPSLKPKNAQKFFRFDNLGEGYSVDEIADRILENIRRKDPFPEETQEKVRKYRQEFPPRPKAKGLAALYYYYCYELNIIVRYPASAKQVSFLMREDIRKLEQLDKQVQLLGKNRIETYEDLQEFREKCSAEKEMLIKTRGELRNKLKRVVRAGDEEAAMAVKKEIAAVTEKLQQIKDDLVTCNRVEEKAEMIQAEYAAMKKEQTEREENVNELLRGCSGTSRKDVPERR